MRNIILVLLSLMLVACEQVGGGNDTTCGYLEDSGDQVSNGLLFLTQHSHNDVAWIEPESYFLPAAADMLAQAVAEAESDSRFRFVTNQQPVIAEFVKRYPERQKALQRLIDEGRFEFSGGFFIQPDLNLVSGESLVRQAIYGQKYLNDNWGTLSTGAWNIDSFGHPLQMPQIARKGGMTSYTFSRGIDDLDTMGGTEFYWQSPDGSTILTHYLEHHYDNAECVGVQPETNEELTRVFQRTKRYSSTPNLFGLIGDDVHVEQFNEYVPEAVEQWNSGQTAGAQATMAVPSEFFAAVEVSGVGLRTIINREFQDDGPQNSPRVFPGVYASRIGVKQRNSRLETLLLDAEKLSAIASLSGFSYPAASFQEQGERIAMNQFHDYLPGTGIDEIYNDGDDLINDLGDRADAAETTLTLHLDEASIFLAGRVSVTSSGIDLVHAVVAFNTMAWERDELVQVDGGDWFGGNAIRLVDSSGSELPYQVVDGSIIFRAKVPSFGYSTYRFVSGDPAVDPVEQVIDGVGAETSVGEFTLTIDDKAHITSLRHTVTQRELIAAEDEAPGGLIWWADELDGDSYDYGSNDNIGTLDSKTTIVTRYNGPVMTRIVATSVLAEDSSVVREIRLVEGSPKIDFLTTFQWKDTNKNVFVSFPLTSTANSVITEGTPYGYVERGTGHYPALRWADYGDDDYGVTLLNQGLFGHDFEKSGEIKTLDVTLLRSLDRAVFGAYHSESMKEHGEHSYSWSLYPRAGSWRLSGAPRRGWELNSPLIVVPAPLTDGYLPMEASYITLGGDSNMVLSSLQKEGNDMVARLYETKGEEPAVTFSFSRFSATTIDETDFLGNISNSHSGGSTVTIRPATQEIVTLRLRNVR